MLYSLLRTCRLNKIDPWVCAPRSTIYLAFYRLVFDTLTTTVFPVAVRGGFHPNLALIANQTDRKNTVEVTRLSRGRWFTLGQHLIAYRLCDARRIT